MSSDTKSQVVWKSGVSAHCAQQVEWRHVLRHAR